MKSAVCAVIVTYFPNLAHLSDLVYRLAGQVGRIVIVDNTPDATSVSAWAKGAPVGQANLRVLSMRRNLGVATALNVGIRHALDANCSHVLLSDQDSVPDPGMVGALLASESELVARGRKVGAIGPGFRNEVVGRSFRFHTRRAGGKWYGKDAPGDADPIIEVAGLITSGMLIPAATLGVVGEMLDALFIDYVDLEWCQRATSLGYGCFATSRALMTHRMGEKALRVWLFGWRSIGEYGPLRLYYQFRNSLYLCRLRHVDFGFKLIQPWFWLGKIYAYVVFGRDRRRSLGMMLRGWTDGLKGRLGPFE